MTLDLQILFDERFALNTKKESERTGKIIASAKIPVNTITHKRQQYAV
jgi:hypothetical protein